MKPGRLSTARSVWQHEAKAKALTVLCPACGRGAGAMCVTSNETEASYPHRLRLEKARAVSLVPLLKAAA